MLTLMIEGKEKEYPEGICYLDLAKEYQSHYSDEIVLAYHGNKLRELNRTVSGKGDIRFVTLRDTAGIETYRRTMVLTFLKAFYDVAGHEHIAKVKVHFSISKGYYIEPVGDFALNQELIDKVTEKIQTIIKEDLPVSKITTSTEDAIRLFHEYGMTEKERLFRFRRASAVNLYQIGNFQDYFYGYMLPSTGYLKHFALFLYKEGIVLQMPVAENPNTLQPFHPSENVFKALNESTKWSEKLGVSCVADLNEKMVAGNIDDLILVQEALQEQKLSEIAAMIKERGNVKFVMIAGPSSSGKTTFSHRLSIQLRAHGLTPHPIGVDNYFLEREQSPVDENGQKNYENLDSIDTELFNQNMTDLLNGKCVDMPTYNFVDGKKEYHGDFLQLGDEDILVIEGIHCLNEKLYPTLPKENMFKIYISALTQLNVDEHNRIATTDGRLIRRMVRDSMHRGTSAEETLARWASVRKGEERNIFPFQDSADIVYNSAQIYELSILKQYAEPLLFSVPTNSPYYQEAKRLLKFLDYFLSCPSEKIPQNSILREFIGGSIFNV